MATAANQRGLSAISLIFVLAFIALITLIVVETVPLYLNQMKVARTVHALAEDPELASADASIIRERLKSRWIIEDIDNLAPNDVKIKRTETGRELIYDYESRANLFYNIFVVIHFSDDVAMRNVPAVN